ncbi:c-type cytochrome [Pontibacter vulgaris]|uniref:c-type cytochrome n=1 Tax=Pontibacter vulgaris TaxID=2905679 RepID=UPI001FA6F3BD|nr:cytochrome c [Pontibacter vulgaris]
MKAIKNIGFKASAVLFSSAVLFACSNEQDPGLEYAPDMYESIPLEPYKQIKANKFNPGGMNLRVPAQGTVARGKMGYNLYLSQDTAEVAGVELTNPLAVNEVNLAEGKVLYSRFCSPCHGEQGDGQGLVGQKFKGVPSYSSGRVASLPAGHIFHVITNGRGRMRPHGSQVTPTERWKIVMYVQQLQTGSVPAAPADSTAQDASGQPSTEVTGSTPNN